MKLHKASLRLAGLYLSIIMMISLFFSANLYELSIQEVDRGFRRQTDIIDRSPDLFLPQDLREQLFSETSNQYQTAKGRILARLAIVNAFILVTGGFISYYLARRTIRPIEEVQEAQSRFTADASHELRTPLAVMQSEIEVALMDPKLNIRSAKAQLNSNLEELSKLISLSEGLLQLSQLDDGYLETKPSDIQTLIEDVVKNNQALAKNKKIKLNVLSNPKYKIPMDPEGIRKVLNILIENAIKYSKDNGQVEIGSKVTDKHIRIEVKDNGIGIKPAEAKHIFDRFYRADSARTKSEAGGYGLGLAIAKSIVELHKGSIEVTSIPDKQTVFSLILPKA